MEKIVICIVLAALPATIMEAAPACVAGSLTTYLNVGSPFTCSEFSGIVNVTFNAPGAAVSYAGLSILGSTSAAPSAITVTPSTSPAVGLDFDDSFSVGSNSLLSTGVQTEVVHFALTSAIPIQGAVFSLDNPVVTAASVAGITVGAGVAVGQELVCVGGQFTSLPTGLVTSVANGVLGTNQFGCSGTTVVGTAADSVGVLTNITPGLLPGLAGLTDTSTILLPPGDRTTLDIIKIQALIGVDGTASTTGFGNSFALTTPEPASFALSLAGAGLLLFSGWRRKRRRQADIG